MEKGERDDEAFCFDARDEFHDTGCVVVFS
jgi:hypothetical protein